MPFRTLRRAAVLSGLLVALISAPQAASAQPAHEGRASIAAVSSVHKKHFTRTAKPTIVGQRSIGSVLVARTGSWKPGGAKFTYRWRIDGYVVAGATSARYTVRKQDAGSRVSVTVRGSKKGYSNAERTSSSLTISVPKPPVAAPAPVQQPTDPIPSDGSYRVGISIAPGTYVTRNPTSSCYWERVTSFDGQSSSIVANDLGNGRRAITIAPGDYGVKFQRCGSWILSTSAAAVPLDSDGQYLVGRDLAPGLYSANPTSSGCYWATLSSLTGDSGSIIANDYLSSPGPVYVQVPATVVAFESSRCGAWQRVG